MGLFLITSEGSVASGIRRIEAVTGQYAYDMVRNRTRLLRETASLLDTSPEQLPEKTQELLDSNQQAGSQLKKLRQDLANFRLLRYLERMPVINDIPVLTAIIDDVDIETLRALSDRFRQQHPSSVAVLATIADNGKPIVLAAVTEDLVSRGLHAGDLVKHVSRPLGGGGGGRPTLAQAGGKDATNLEQALASVPAWVTDHLQDG